MSFVVGGSFPASLSPAQQRMTLISNYLSFDDAGGDHDCNDTALLHAKCMMPVLADGGGGGNSTASTESTKDV